MFLLRAFARFLLNRPSGPLTPLNLQFLPLGIFTTKVLKNINNNSFSTPVCGRSTTRSSFVDESSFQAQAVCFDKALCWRRALFDLEFSFPTIFDKGIS